MGCKLTGGNNYNGIMTMKNFTLTLLLLILTGRLQAKACTVADSLSQHSLDSPNGHGMSFGAGIAYCMPVGNLSSFLKNTTGYQVQLAFLLKRLTIEGCVSGYLAKSQSEFSVGTAHLPLQSPLEFYTVGIQASYAVVYSDYWRISPLIGPGWNALLRQDSSISGNRLTGVIGVKAEFNLFGRTNLGGLTSGLVLPIYCKYLYAMPIALAPNLTGGAHYVSVGMEIYIKEGDK